MAVLAMPMSALAANLMTNPGFESDFQGWNDWGGSYISTTTVHSGSKAAGIDPTSGGGRAQRFNNLVAGTQYTMCAWSKLESLSIPAWIGMNVRDASDTVIGNHQWTVAWTSWERRSVTFVYPANGAYSDVWVWTEASSAHVYVDDFILVAGPSCSNAAPDADFSSSVTDLSVDFTDASSDSDGSIVSWSWDFGDGNSSTEQLPPTHTYALDDVYSVTLTVTDNEGASNSVTKTVAVGTAVQDKMVIGYFPWWRSEFTNIIDYSAFSHLNYFHIWPNSNGSLVTRDVNLNDLATFKNNAHAAGATVSISVGGAGVSGGYPGMAGNASARATFIQNVLDFVLDNDLDGVDLDWEPVDTAQKKDNYSTLIEELDAALDLHGKLLSVAVSAERVEIRNWAIDNLDWVGVMAYDMNWANAEHSAFADMVTAIERYANAGVPADKMIVGLPFYGRNDGWTSFVNYVDLVAQCNPLPSENYCNGHFFNGIDLIQSKAQHILDNDYAGAMIWEITADTFDDPFTSLTSALTDVLGTGSAPNAAPSAEFTFTTSDLTVNFTDMSSDSDGNIASWSWDFGDGNTSTAQNPSHTYAAGTYAVTLTVTDNDSGSDSASQSVTVTALNQAPTALFSYATNELTANFINTSSDSDGTIVSWAWTFGDGNASTAQNPSHTYAAADTYAVTLTVTDNDGAGDSASTSVTVTAPPPQPPAAPSSLTADVVKTGKGKRKTITNVILNWSDNSNNETGFEVERCLEIVTGKGKKRTVTCDYAPYATVGADVTTLQVGTESGYRYRVRAVNVVGASAFSNDVKI